MLDGISIRTKIATVLAFLLIALTGIGLLAVRKMEAINANAVDIQTNWLPSVRLLGELRGGVISYRNNLREHMLAETLEGKLDAEKAISGVVASNNAIRAQYEKTITSPEEQALYRDWAKVWDSYKAVAEQVIVLSRASVGKMPREAHELHNRDASALGLKSDEILGRDIDLNNRGADVAGKEATASYNTAFTLLAIIIGASAVFGIGIGIYLVKDVFERHCFDRQADASAQRGGSGGQRPTPGYEDRNWLHGQRAAGVQAGLD